MESLLGFRQPSHGDILPAKSPLNFKLVPWINWDEWDSVRLSLFSSSPESVASALRRISTWQSRGCLPIAIQVTASIIEVQQKDPFFRNDSVGEAADSEEILAMLYCMAIIRLVNGVVEKKRKNKKVSIASAAQDIGLPRLLVDIRHEGSHRGLPSLHLGRLASVEAVDWLKAYYWEPQKKSILDLGDPDTNHRSDIENKLYELALYLRAKKTSTLDASPRRKSSKKQLKKLLNNVLCLYSSSSGEVVNVLFDILLRALDPSDKVGQEDSHTADHMVAELSPWNSVLTKLLKKKPELIQSLLKTFLEDINAQSRRCEIDEHLSPVPVAKSHRSVQLVNLCEWLVKNFIKSAIRGESTIETSKSSLELLRKCLAATCHGNQRLMICALALARSTGNKVLISKLEKFLPVSASDPNTDVTFSSEASRIPESFLSREQAKIDEAEKRLALIKLRCKNNRMEPHVNQEENKRWVKVKSWNPCPIGMLLQTNKSGYLPILDYSCSGPELPETVTAEDQPGSCQCSRKRASDHDGVLLDRPDAKKSRDSLTDDVQTPVAEDIMGHLMIDGIWKKVGEEEVAEITSAVRILV